MKVLVCGGRDFNDRKFLFSRLDELHLERQGINEIVSGGAHGADWLAEEWSRSRQVKRTVYPAKWKLLGKQAGTARNYEMLAMEKPDLVIGFPGGKGTWHMLTIAKENGCETIQALPEGNCVLT